ncbi:hypothetical protein FBZ94_109166 [Bradyrhizobium sacchari]|uniref:Uncharacterized protein n=1 Tax=Bradyrhizobium sacchari TaxID=1399419 RepID=A0A560I0K4_9BRAD|nr:hypothetical protein FBZ94_109166 [Bradyrhizobium sacchari]TWB70197.1 hypothetical protein FBZ95_108196 [Bradyrhizobium sacchari]
MIAPPQAGVISPLRSKIRVQGRRAVVGGLHPHLCGQPSMEIVPDKWADVHPTFAAVSPALAK